MKPNRRDYPSTLKGLQQYNKDKAAFNNKIKEAKGGRPLRTSFPSTVEGLKNYNNAFKSYKERTKLKIDALNKGSDTEESEPQEINKLDPTQFDNRRNEATDESADFDQRMERAFPKDDRISSATFEEERELNLDAMSQYSDSEEADTSDYTTLADLVTGGNDKSNADGTNGTSTRSKLSIGPATTGTGRAAMRAQNVERFGEERVSYLEKQNSAFQDMKKGKMTKKQFADAFPKSNLAKRLKLKLKK